MNNIPDKGTAAGYMYLAYNPKDSRTVSAITAKMDSDGCNICVDENGCGLNESSLKNLSNAAVCVVFVSRAAVCSHKFRSMLTTITSMEKPLVAVFLENVNLTICERLQFARADMVNWQDNRSFEELYAIDKVSKCRVIPEKPACLKFTITRQKTGESAEISGVEFAVGRSESMSDFTIRENSAISRLHIILKADAQKCVAVDQNSSNATYLNGKELTPMVEYEVKNGDILELADEKFLITSENI